MSDHTKHARYWKLSLIGLVGLFAAAMVVSFSLASRRVSRVVDRDYYTHGLDYQREGELLANGVRMGWRLETAYAGGVVRLKVTDGAGRPVSGGRVVLRNTGTGDGPSRGTGASTPAFAEESPGIYSARLAPGQSGDMRREVMVSRGNAAVATRLVVLR